MWITFGGNVDKMCGNVDKMCGKLCGKLVYLWKC